MTSFCVRKGIYFGIDVLYNGCRSEGRIFYFLHKIACRTKKKKKPSRMHETHTKKERRFLWQKQCLMVTRNLLEFYF